MTDEALYEALRLLGDGRPVDAIRLLKQAGLSLRDAHEAVNLLAENFAELEPVFLRRGAA